ncbi:unnamed protein product [Notodromas monacha]|uniref:UDP-N-acetylglucosamine transporter n=1 Tax=Notodromas monacha TaxID=399045 RepID=A0A7R9GEG2_9CRUS|nr:unnamed protein product [Notodromas monacha]CAG0919704.1 unnamed protein product [Notodromas monacha]
MKGFAVKASCLVVLTLVTTVTVVLLRYSRNVPTENRYISSTAIVFSEILKVIVCLLALFYMSGFHLCETVRIFYTDVLTNWEETSKLLLPSALYTAQNNLLFIALSHLNAATYQRFKILTTALFSVLLLDKKLGPWQWCSLVVLMIGVTLVQLDPEDLKQEAVNSTSSTVVGLVCVVIASLSSGLAGVYFERLIKMGNNTKAVPPGLTIRNLQMGITSVLFGVLASFYNDSDEILKRGVFAGYNHLTWCVILLQPSFSLRILEINVAALGGLIVAITIKYTDNILKGFATSFSIILSAVCSYAFLGDLSLSSFFLTGASLVIAATFLYGIRAPAPLKQEPQKSLRRFVVGTVALPCGNVMFLMSNMFETYFHDDDDDNVQSTVVRLRLPLASRHRSIEGEKRKLIKVAY